MSELNSVEDLVFSRSFRQWVLSRDSPEQAFWENWLQRNPEKAEVVKNAKAVILALHVSTTVLSTDEIDEEARKALIRLKEAPRYLPLEGFGGHGHRLTGVLRSPRIWIWALFVAAVGTSGYVYYQVHFHRDLLPVFRSHHQPVQEQVADASTEQTFHLPDGSLVRLGKSSRLYFPAHWGSDKDRREVFLEGEASFDIRKNPGVPFYVYTDQLITRALGTRIVVRAFPADNQTVVTDKTGSVSVYRQGEFAEQSGSRNEVAVVLGPNQEVTYDRKEHTMRKTLAEQPELLELRSDTVLVYQRTPVRKVFGQLYELYGIPIQFDGGALDSCPVTATMGRQSFFERLDLICKTIGGAYEVIDGSVVVTAMGCR